MTVKKKNYVFGLGQTLGPLNMSSKGGGSLFLGFRNVTEYSGTDQMSTVDTRKEGGETKSVRGEVGVTSKTSK